MRKIDKVSTSRAKPMRLLVLGLSRTGTSSLVLALDKLGYKTFHMNECLDRPTFFFPLWLEALKAKFGSEGKPYGKEEFDKLLGEYDALSDAPAIWFAEEFISSYPDAKVILTLRDPEKWVDSMRATIWRVHSWSSWDYLRPFWSLISGWRKVDTVDWDVFINTVPGTRNALSPPRRDYLSAEYRRRAIERFNQHNDYIRSMVPQERLLEFRPQDGWKPLCRFLGHDDVPDAEYPHAWDKDDLVKFARILWWLAVGVAGLKLAAPVAVAVGCRWLLRRAGWM